MTATKSISQAVRSSNSLPRPALGSSGYYQYVVVWEHRPLVQSRRYIVLGPDPSVAIELAQALNTANQRAGTSITYSVVGDNGPMQKTRLL